MNGLWRYFLVQELVVAELVMEGHFEVYFNNHQCITVFPSIRNSIPLNSLLFCRVLFALTSPKRAGLDCFLKTVKSALCSILASAASPEPPDKLLSTWEPGALLPSVAALQACATRVARAMADARVLGAEEARLSLDSSDSIETSKVY